jgi:acetyltransferase-like isoleucine patch superfamily enzyme
MNPMKLLRSLIELGKGWTYLLAFVSGGNFLRLARLKSRGRNVKISPTAFFKFPEQISIGNDTFINHNCCIWAALGGTITIGDDVLLGPGVCVIASNHGIDSGELVRLQEGQDAGIVIGNDVWIGANASILAGVHIEDGCVVGAGAVVTKSLPANAVCGGVPAKVIRFRTPRPAATYAAAHDAALVSTTAEQG